MIKKLGHYEIVSELGRGGMGVVYKGYEPSLDRHVAIKVLSQQMASDPILVARFQREARSVAALNHPHIIQIFFIGQSEEQHYFVMEFVEGESLSAYIRREHPLAVNKAMTLLKQAAEGLAAAHAIGVIHRDIKPANLMLDPNGRVKIADFGIAYTPDLQNKLTATGQFLGTPGYLSPEVCMGEKADARTDIFSLGVVFFEMLTGKVPFHADSPLAMLSKVVKEEIPDVRSFNAAVQPEIQAILNKMVEKSPEQRYQSCAELIATLDHQLSLIPTQPVDYAAMTAPTEVITEGIQKPPPPPLAPPPVPPSQPQPAAPPPPPPRLAGVKPPPRAAKRKTSWLVPVLLFLLLPAIAAGGFYAWKSQQSTDQDDSNVVDIAGLDQDETSDLPSKGDGDEVDENAFAMTELKDHDDQPDPQKQEPSGTMTDNDSKKADTTGPSPNAMHSENTVEGPEATHFNEKNEPKSGESESGEPETEKRVGAVSSHQELSEPKNNERVQAIASGKRGLDGTAQDQRTQEAIKKPIRAKNSVPHVVLVVTGDAWIGDTVTRTLGDALEGHNFEMMDREMMGELDQWIGEQSVKLRGLSQYVYTQGADLLVVAEIKFLGERELQYLGRQTTAYKSALSIKTLDLASRKKLGKEWRTELEYTQVNATKKAEEACAKLDRDLVATLRQAADQLR